MYKISSKLGAIFLSPSLWNTTLLYSLENLP